MQEKLSIFILVPEDLIEKAGLTHTANYFLSGASELTRKGVVGTNEAGQWT